MSPLTATSVGVIGQLLVAAQAMARSRGAIKVGLPFVDDEGRDLEIHLAGLFKSSLSLQVKTSAVLQRRGKLRLLKMTFILPRANQVDDPHFWYLFAFLDLESVQLADWVFLVPSKIVHSRCARGTDGEPIFYFQASMEEGAHDQWTRFRIRPEYLGERLVALLHDRSNFEGVAA
jgi:hypothetical protein